MSRLLPLLRCAFPRARFLVRLDGGFATPEVFDFLDTQARLDYVVAMANNAVLARHAGPAMLVARARSGRSEQTEHVYTDTDYAAGRWNRTRRVVIKAEVVRPEGREPRDNPRFVVTSMRQTPRFLYEKVYCARGDVENRIKELKALQIDRTSCHAFAANQLRVLLTAAACVLMQELRSCAAGNGVRPRAGALAAGPAAQVGRAGRMLRPALRPAPAARDAGPCGVAADRVRARGARRIAAPARRIAALRKAGSRPVGRSARCPSLSAPVIMPSGRSNPPSPPVDGLQGPSPTDLTLPGDRIAPCHPLR